MFLAPDPMSFVCRRSGTSADAIYALFSLFCYVGGFGDLGDPVLPTPRGVSGDVVTVYAYQDTERRFVQSLGVLRAFQTRAKNAKWLFPPIMA